MLDANVLINAKNTYYPFDLVPGFWNWLKQEAEENRVYSIVRVRDELRKGNDQLARWARELPESFWLRDNTPATASALADLSGWANTPGRYSAIAVQTFYGSADYLLAAQAKANGFTVVTHETRAPKKTNRIRLPDACDALGVSVMTPFDWLRREASRF